MAGRAGKLVLVGVDKAVEARWEPARRNAAATTGTTAERVAQLRRTFWSVGPSLDSSRSGVQAPGASLAATDAERATLSRLNATLLMRCPYTAARNPRQMQLSLRLYF